MLEHIIYHSKNVASCRRTRIKPCGRMHAKQVHVAGVVWKKILILFLNFLRSLVTVVFVGMQQTVGKFSLKNSETDYESFS